MKVDIIDYFDVWGNEQDGWEVNDVIRHNVEVNNMEDIWDKLIENRIISADAKYEDFFVCDWEDGFELLDLETDEPICCVNIVEE